LEDPTAVKNIFNAEFTVIPGKGEIYLPNMSGNEKIDILDISGRKLNFENSNIYKVNAGAYIVKINNFTTKVIVK
jgi:hypothetical protein